MKNTILIIAAALLAGLSAQGQQINDLDIAEMIICKTPYEARTILAQHNIGMEITVKDGERAIVSNGDHIVNYGFNTKKGKITQVFVRYHRYNSNHIEMYNSINFNYENDDHYYEKDMGKIMGHLILESISKCRKQ